MRFFDAQKLKKTGLALALTILFLLPLPIFLGISNFFEQKLDKNKLPYVFWHGIDPQSQMYIAFETEQPFQSKIYYGTSPTNLELKGTITSPTTFHKYLLESLSSNTVYYYQAAIVTEDGKEYLWGTLGKFRTAPNGFAPFNFTAYGDSQRFMGTGHFGSLAKAFGKSTFDTDFLFIAGDVCQEPDNQATWNNYFKSAQQFSHKFPIVSVPGNHDDNKNNTFYAKYFGVTYSPDKFYYSFNYSNIQFIGMQISVSGEWDINDPKVAENFAWLNQTLMNGQDKMFRIVVFHRDIITSNHREDRALPLMTPILMKYNISLILHGHMHHYERLLINDTTVLCIAGGGGFLDFAYQKQPESQVIRSVPHFIQVFQNVENELVIKAQIPNGSVFDQFKLISQNGKAIQAEV
jgi:Icc-related predicted phosphoesterase